MTNQGRFIQLCMDNDIETLFIGDVLFLICSSDPPKKIKEQLIRLIPKDLKHKFKVGIKSSTIAGVNTYLSMGGCKNASFDDKGTGHLEIKIPASGEVNHDSPVWDQIQAILKTDQFLQTWRIVTPNEVIRSYNRKIAEEQRPDREKSITPDDITNLKIDLEGDVLDVIRRL